MTGAIWTGFKSRPWNPAECRTEREAWEARHLPALRARREEAITRRERGRAALASLPVETRDAITAAYGGPL